MSSASALESPLSFGFDPGHSVLPANLPPAPGDVDEALVDEEFDRHVTELEMLVGAFTYVLSGEHGTPEDKANVLLIVREHACGVRGIGQTVIRGALWEAERRVRDIKPNEC